MDEWKVGKTKIFLKVYGSYALSIHKYFYIGLWKCLHNIEGMNITFMVIFFILIHFFI